MNQIKNAQRAIEYYTNELARGNYYIKGGDTPGKWGGKTAEHLGLSGEVTAEEFALLATNQSPLTGKPLTPGNKEVCGYDLNYHCPKSVSILYAYTKDPAILEAFEKAVAETMSDLEAHMRVRVNSGRTTTERVTGNMLYSTFIHTQARPVDGISDPHLHAHNFTFNVTYDSKLQDFRAGQFREVQRQTPLAEAAFHNRMANSMKQLGYGIERTEKGYEVAGVTEAMIKKFSRRTEEIETVARIKGITDPKQKDLLGAQTRKAKVSSLSEEQSQTVFSKSLTNDAIPRWKSARRRI